MATEETVNQIASWIAQQLGGVQVAHAYDFDRDATVFRPQKPGVKMGEIEISDEALGDHTVETIIGDLARHAVPKRLSDDPTMRLAYTVDRDVPHLETRPVTCDGRQYRFVRDSHHAVRVYTSDDQLLERLSSPLPVLSVSLFRRDLADLQQNVRDWRGPSQ